MGILRKLKVLITSRRLFSNWLQAGFKYYLIKYGMLKGDIIVRCSDREYMLNPRIYPLIVSAYYDGVFEELECSDSLYAVLTWEGRKIRIYDSFEFLYDIVFENFIGGAYSDVDVRDRTVVDVGAGVGDTAILFSLRGARRVIALEPFPSLYKRALINVKINGIEDRVLLINAGLGSSDEEICTELSDVHGYYLFRSSSKCDIKIRIYTLSSLIREFRIESNSILKMDCEGCEYEVVLNAKSEDIKTFEQVIIEYHDGYRELKKFLEDAGFKTMIKRIRSVQVPVERHGYIVARRGI